MPVVMQTNLFGGEVPAESLAPESHSPYIDWKRRHNYRLSSNRNKSCRVCRHYLHESHHDRKYSKCVKLGSRVPRPPTSARIMSARLLNRHKDRY
jgi:hypothetical protein